MTKARTFEDAFNLLCGDKLGSGIHRDVYRCRIRPDLVVKVEICEDWRFFANVHEMQFWDAYQDCKPVARWLAPCEYMSPDGRILLQRKVIPVSHAKQLPARLPTFLTDIKRENFGWLDGRIVACDYALHNTDASTKLRAAQWRKDDD